MSFLNKNCNGKTGIIVSNYLIILIIKCKKDANCIRLALDIDILVFKKGTLQLVKQNLP